jgi:predicted TIM-barrel fold metal-dependent hydrolase
MKMFYLNRVEDESGKSGTGRVAQGFVFDNGKVALTWLSDHPSVTVYDTLGEVRALHGHEGKTEVIMEPDWKRAFQELKSALMDFDLMETLTDRLPKAGEALSLVDKNTK